MRQAEPSYAPVDQLFVTMLDIPPGLEPLLPRFIAEMISDGDTVKSLAAGDRLALAEFVHGMRGKCAMFGEGRLFALLSELEGLAPVAAAAEIDAIVGRVLARVGELRRIETSPAAAQ